MRQRLLADSYACGLPAEQIRERRLPDQGDLLERASVDLENYLPEDILVKVDRASMLTPRGTGAAPRSAVGRVPCRKVPSALKRRPATARFSRAGGARVLPPQFDRQRKQGFSIPLAGWLDGGEWSEFFRDVLLGPQSTLFEHETVRALLRGQQRGRATASGCSRWSCWSCGGANIARRSEGRRMRTELLEVLRCRAPGSGCALDAVMQDGRIRAGRWSPGRRATLPCAGVHSAICARVKLRRQLRHAMAALPATQLDSFSGQPISRSASGPPRRGARRSARRLGARRRLWSRRFAEVALDAGARVVALDYSSAVDACCRTSASGPTSTSCRVISTPCRCCDDFSLRLLARGAAAHAGCRARIRLAAADADAGRALVRRLLREVLEERVLPKYWLRPFTRRMPEKTLFAWCERLVPGCCRSAVP